MIAELVAEVGPLWHERHQAALASRPRRERRLLIVDRLLAILVHFRHSVTHDVLVCWFGVDRSTITRAFGEVQPLLTMRGCTIAPDIWLRSSPRSLTISDPPGRCGIILGTEILVRRPAAGSKGRERFISGKNQQNAVKSVVVMGAGGRVLFCSPVGKLRRHHPRPTVRPGQAP